MKTKSPQRCLAEAQALAIETFGSKSKADAWLNQVNLILGATPISFVETGGGLLEIKRILHAISYGNVM